MKHHAVALPYGAQGHLNPIMRLCKILALQGFTITFVNIDPVHYRIQEVQQQRCCPVQASESCAAAARPEDQQGGGDGDGKRLDIRRAHVAVEGLDLRQDFRLSLEQLFVAQQGIGPQVETLLRQLQEQGSPATCIICDNAMIGPAQQVATKFNIPWIPLFTSPLSLQLLVDYVTQGSAPAEKGLSMKAVLEAIKDEEGREQVFCEDLPGLPTIYKCDLPNFKHVVDNSEYIWTFIGDALRQCKGRAHAMLFNTYEALEGPAFKVMSDMWSTTLPAYAMGPFIEPLEEECSCTSLWKEDEGCMQWLDQQPAGSVIYISYGSFTLLLEEQLDEVVAGLLSSQQQFLWAFRPDLAAAGRSSAYPGRLLSQAQQTGKAYVAEWAPQLRVLAHPSVGGFLTHCGWNSVTEAISAGVPMLCWPYFAEQSLNAKYAADVWHIGLYFESVRKGCLVHRGEVESMILRLMQGHDGRRLRRNVLQLQEAGRQAWLPPAGSSFNSVQRLIQSLEQSKRQPGRVLEDIWSWTADSSQMMGSSP